MENATVKSKSKTAKVSQLQRDKWSLLAAIRDLCEGLHDGSFTKAREYHGLSERRSRQVAMKMFDSDELGMDTALTIASCKHS